MPRRSSRVEASKAEDQALRLAARGLNDREIGVALGLSESEARRKRQLGLERRREERTGEDQWEAVDIELAEALRTAYRDHDEAPPGSPVRVGCLKVISELITRRARLRGVEVKRVASPGPGSANAGTGSSGNPDWPQFKADIREAEESLRDSARSVIEMERAAGRENAHPPEEKEASPNEEKEEK
jgi:hypothetical protein